MGKVSIRLTDAEENLLKKDAKRANITLTDLIRQHLFEEIGGEEFHEFKLMQIEANEQIGNLLLELTHHIRLTENIMAMLYKKLDPQNAEATIQMIKNALDKEAKEMTEYGTT
jgi:hypothetical protein